METKETRGRKPIHGHPMTQSDYDRRHKEKLKRSGAPSSYELRAITYAALKRSWGGVSYTGQLDIYGAVEREAAERGLDPAVVVERFGEAMTK